MVQAGSLNPPAGPVAPTLKTLAEVEPRIAINATNTPGDADSLFKITQPGSYYLTGNITGVSGKHGIEIAVAAFGPGVTIDLMGFELAGVAGSLDGISATVINLRNIAIRNGAIRDWDGDGIDILNSLNNLFADVRAIDNGGGGILAGDTNLITGCMARQNALEGIRLGRASTVTSCTTHLNAGHGISVGIGSTLAECSSNGNGGSGFVGGRSCTMTGCTAHGNQVNGIEVIDVATISHCTCSENTLNGIEAFQDITINDCTVFFNGVGISTVARTTITRCTVTLNHAHGISLSGFANQVTDNICSTNGVFSPGSGIYTTGNGNRIEGNTVEVNDFGIFVDGATLSGNVVVRNVARSNTTNYSFPASGNFIGTLIGTSGGMNSATNSLININF